MRLKEAFSLKQNLSYIFNRPDHNLRPLDGFRALSVIYLVLFHAFFHIQFMVPRSTFLKFLGSFPIYLTWVWHGDKGVDMFFILSGFLITLILMKEYSETNTLNLKKFYINRWLRLTPLYLVAMFVTAFLFNGQNIEFAWANILYVNNFITFKNMFMMWSWSQAVEQQFYILCPIVLLLIIFKIKYKWQAIAILLIASFAIRGFIILTNEIFYKQNMSSLIFPRLKNFNPSYFDLIYFKLHTRFGPIACGMLAAYIHLNHSENLSGFFSKKNSKIINTIIFSILILIILLISIPYYKPDLKVSNAFICIFLIAGRNIFSIGVTFIMLSSLYPVGVGKAINKFLSLKIWYPLAQLSYSIYLFHLLIGGILYYLMINLFGNITNPDIIEIFGAAILVIILTFLFSIFAYAGIERPFMNLRKNFYS